VRPQAHLQLGRQPLAAKRTIVTVEEIVDELHTPYGAIVLPGWAITADAEVPGGAHPSYAAGYSVRDNAYYQRWDAISRDRSAFGEWLLALINDHAGEQEAR